MASTTPSQARRRAIRPALSLSPRPTRPAAGGEGEKRGRRGGEGSQPPTRPRLSPRQQPPDIDLYAPAKELYLGDRCQVSQLRTIVSRPSRRRHTVQIVTAFDDDPGDFSLALDDGDEQFGVAPYSSESEWSESEWSDDDVVVLTSFTDVELPMTVKSQAEGALTIAAHRLATIDKGHKKSSR